MDARIKSAHDTELEERNDGLRLVTMVATFGHLVAAIGPLGDAQLKCHVAGGWAEEMLGRRPAGPHGDVDLIHDGGGRAAVDAWLRGPPPGITEIAAKRFARKRAFLMDGMCCEIVLVRQVNGAPVTLFWGDVPFVWERPLLHRSPLQRDGYDLSVLSAANLAALRARHRETQPWRWRDPASLVENRSASQIPAPLAGEA